MRKVIDELLYYLGALCLIAGGFVLGGGLYAPIVHPQLNGPEQAAWTLAGATVCAAGWLLGSWRPFGPLP